MCVFFYSLQVVLPPIEGDLPVLGALSPTAYADYIDWWQAIMGVFGNNEEPPVSEPPSYEPIDQSTCPPCSKYTRATAIGRGGGK